MNFHHEIALAVVVNWALKMAGAMACSEAGFSRDGLTAPVFEAVPFEVALLDDAALLEAGAWASKVLHRTMLVNIDLHVARLY